MHLIIGQYMTSKQETTVSIGLNFSEPGGMLRAYFSSLDIQTSFSYDLKALLKHMVVEFGLKTIRIVMLQRIPLGCP